MFDALKSKHPSKPHALSSAGLLPLHLQGLCLEIGGRRLINGVDLRLEDTSLSVIMGANGAGKSLLLRLMHGLIAPTMGEILWGGIPMNDRIRQRQGMVFQKPVLLRRTARGNITHALALRGVPRSERGPRAHQALKLAGLEHHAFTVARVLSGGEQQRLCLARALSLDPDILFLDEPTTNLDPASILAIERQLIQAQERGIKVIMVTHDLGQARRLAQEIIFMHQGQVLEHQRASGFFRGPDTDVGRAFIAGELVLP
jgi:tungstate transport system ATP-binding protein